MYNALSLKVENAKVYVKWVGMRDCVAFLASGHSVEFIS